MSRLIDADALKANVPETRADIFEDCRRCTTLMDWEVKELVDKQPTVAASPWHRVEEPPKEHGPFLCAAKSERNGQTHWFFELCWYADGDLKDVVFDAEQDSGFYSWSASQDRDIDSMVDYWMPIEPPREGEHGN